MFLLRRVLPSVLLFASVVAAAVAGDLVLHWLDAASVGRWLGPAGTLCIGVSFAHSLRKRRILKRGSPKTFLAAHEVLAWAGTVLLLVHAGIHLNAWVPWLALLALLLVAASGVTGRYLLANAKRDLKERRADLQKQGLSADEVERRFLVASLLVDAMQKWRSIHMMLNAVLLALVLVHVATVVVLW